MAKPNVLLQLDSDPHASSFDAVVAADSGVAHILQYSGVHENDVPGLVHGAIFTRGVDELRHTAIFVGGSDVARGERLLDAVVKTFFGPLRVSVMLDANGANTTAVAAVLRAAEHLDLGKSTFVILAGTGPVGQRVARLLSTRCQALYLGSRGLDRAAAACDSLSATATARLTPFQSDSASKIADLLEVADGVVAAGAAGIQLLSRETMATSKRLKVAIDLNAVPPLGIEGVEVTDRGAAREGVVCYGAIGVGALKMKIHRAAVRRLFESNDQLLDAETIHQLAVETVLADPAS